MSAAAAIQPFKQLDADTEEALRASIKRFGVVVPIVLDGKGRIIDGHHRARIARELNVPCPQVKRAVTNDDDANALAYSLNADRRQMTVEQRREIVTDLHAQGYSLRAIAGVVGVSHVQVRTDVEKSGVNPLTPDEDSNGRRESEATRSDAVGSGDDEQGTAAAAPSPTPNPAPRTTGTDGKSYPRHRPPPKNPARTREAIEAKWKKIAELAGSGHTSRQTAAAVDMTRDGMVAEAIKRGISFPADETVPQAGIRNIDPNRVVGETVATVEGAAFALSVVPLDVGRLDPSSIEGWVSSLNESLRSLTTLRNNLKKELTRA